MTSIPLPTPAPRNLQQCQAFLLTPSHAAGAVAMIQLDGDVDAMLAGLRIKPVSVGKVVVRQLANIDEGLVARWSDNSCLLMPHGGVGVVRTLLDAIGQAGIAIQTHGAIEATASNARSLFPEARSDVEALALLAMTRAASPLAVELLLKQHELWREASLTATLRSPRDVVLRRFIDPPLVVMLGQSNIGKSTLTNSLAKRNVSVVADEPGTTRDHVGVMLDLGGLVVRFVDTPGLRDNPTAEEAAARTIAFELARRADLLLFVGTKERLPVTQATLSLRESNSDFSQPRSLVIALQSDAGIATWKHDLAVSAKTGNGIDAFVTLVRETLVPSRFLTESQPWRFW